jgi:hypothetical protein
MAQPFGHDIPRLSWLSAKTYPQSNPRKNRSGLGPERVSAATEDCDRFIHPRLTHQKLEAERKKLEADRTGCAEEIT